MLKSFFKLYYSHTDLGTGVCYNHWFPIKRDNGLTGPATSTPDFVGIFQHLGLCSQSYICRWRLRSRVCSAFATPQHIIHNTHKTKRAQHAKRTLDFRARLLAMMGAPRVALSWPQYCPNQTRSRVAHRLNDLTFFDI